MFGITERNSAEQRARESAELVQGQNRVLELIVQNASLAETLDLLVRVIEELAPGMLGSILLLDPDGEHLRHGAAPSLPKEYVRAIDGEPIGPSAGSCGTAAYRREAVIVEDIAKDPLWAEYREIALRNGLRACWSTPIFEEQQNLLGTFALYFQSPRVPSARHRELIEMATHTAAIAIVKNRKTEALQTSEERLRAANAALAGELEERIRTEREIQALSARLINAQEDERARVARELHDDLSQQIAALSIGISNLKRSIPGDLAESRGQSERIREKLVHLAESIRRLSHELHPAILQHCGLDVALRAFCSEFGALAGIKVVFESSGVFDGISPAVTLCVYRVAQEALQNIARHAKTDAAEVRLKRTRENLILTVSDNGIGMNLNGGRTGGGLGLVNIKERARLVCGAVDLQSRPNRGTSLTVTVPVPK